MAVKPLRIAIIGAGGAIGGALLQCYRQAQPEASILAYSRTAAAAATPQLQWQALDLLDERSIAAAAAHAAAGGLLHAPGRRPEKSLRELDPAWLQHNFLVNSVGPALLLKHFLPLLRRDERAVFAALSARVGSISDNRLGGWYSYRASKAALNMLVATAAIELKRTHPRALLIGLHPGTVDSRLSAPFQTQLRAGQLQTPQQAAAHLHRVIESADAALSGHCLAWDGSVVPA